MGNVFHPTYVHAALGGRVHCAINAFLWAVVNTELVTDLANVIVSTDGPEPFATNPNAKVVKTEPVMNPTNAFAKLDGKALIVTNVLRIPVANTEDVTDNLTVAFATTDGRVSVVLNPFVEKVAI